MLTEGEIEEFKRIVLEVYGIELTDAGAMDQGSRLIQLFELFLKNKIASNVPIVKEAKKVQNEYR